MTTPSTLPGQVARSDITSGLRQLADYLDANPAIPVAPYGWDLMVGTHTSDDRAGVAEIDRVAADLGVAVYDDTANGGHYNVTRSFGPISYTAFHISARSKAAYRAYMTYADCVLPDDDGTSDDADDPPQAA
jgi:hypothetical protein